MRNLSAVGITIVLVNGLLTGCGRTSDPPSPRATQPTTPVPPRSPDPIEQAMSAARTAFADAELDRARSAAIAESGRLVPRTDLGACPLDHPERLVDADAADSTRTMEVTAVTDFVINGQLSPFDSRREHRERALARARESQFFQRRVPVIAEYDLALWVDSLVQAQILDDHRFAGGRLVARLLVWSRSQRKLVCLAAIDSESSESITVHSFFTREPPSDLQAGAAANMDLFVNAVLSGLDHLVPAGYPPDTDAGVHRAARRARR